MIMITNGSIRNSIFWKEIGKKGKNLSVIFSIDGLHDTNHIYRVGINWDHVIRNAKAYINAGGKAIWKCIVFRHNQHQLEKIQQTAQDMGFAGVNFVMPRLYEFDAKPQWLIYNKGNFLGELLPPSDISYLDLLKFSKSFVAEPQTKKYQLELDKICPDLNRGRFYITYRHHVIPCCMMHNYLYETAHNPGSKRLVNELVTDLDSIDLSKKKFSEILRSKFYNNSLEEHFKSGPYLPVCSKSCKDRIVSKLKNIKINRKL